jgi:(1->4)-alpha-D-glucan 1-alpha-D-glucosylmutase
MLLSTYRIQLNPGFGFAQARTILPYLKRLGITTLYLSPVLKARAGSTHGYDVVDPNELNPELGGREQFDGLLEELEKLDMGLLLDIVPNHMAFSGENQMLVDVLENGPSSHYFEFFDVQWDHPVESLRGRLLAPFLGSFYGDCLERGEIRLGYDEKGFHVRYFQLRLPLRLDSYVRILSFRRRELASRLGRSHPEYVKYLGLLYVLGHLPPGEHDIQAGDRYDQIAFAKAMLWELYQENEQIREFVEENIRINNGKPGVSGSFDALEELLKEQYFRLAFWKVGTEELNYRRFFNLNELITLRVEEEKVLNQTHSLVFELGGRFTELGLRTDHVDGLYDPLAYLRRLREHFPGAYIVVEKILALAEELPKAWPVEGTTGYDFLNVVNGLFCNRRNHLKLNKIYRRFQGSDLPFSRLLEEKKRLIAEKHMVGDIDNLANLLKRLAGRYRYGSDFTLYGFKKALAELLAMFPVYRSYVSAEELSDADRLRIGEAIRRTKANLPDFVHELEFIEKIFKLRFEEDLDPENQRQWYHFIQRFQQFTGPLMAKGMEDTALYIYNRLLSLNEVGGNPEKFGVSLIEFHHFNKKRSSSWPRTMNATSSHDTKRGEDVRARLNVLSELPMEWEHQVGVWSRSNKRYKAGTDSGEAPDSNDEYLLYQTLVGAWPFAESEIPEFKERLESYLIKAVREAKVHTAWLAPDSTYEKAFLDFLAALLDSREDNPFLESFLPFQRRIAWYGMLNSLSQVLLKLTCPGTPDFYQGSEFWDLNLVDPDNRRPVDFARRSAVLERIEQTGDGETGELISGLFSGFEDGAIKLFLVYRALQARRVHGALFTAGSYTPLGTSGRRKNNLVVFARNRGSEWAITAVPRFYTELCRPGSLPVGPGTWEDTRVRLPRGIRTLRNLITGERLEARRSLSAEDLFAAFPGALLVGEKGKSGVSG